MAQWLGYLVSIKCGEDDFYQGEIKSATATEISLVKAFCNGIPCKDNQIVIRANEINELKLIDKQSSSQQQSSTISTIPKPIAKRAGRTQSTSDIAGSSATQKNASFNGAIYTNKSKLIDIELKAGNSNQPNTSFDKNGTPNRKDRSRGKWNKGRKDEECFGSPIDDKITKDFDFEKNLALFDKQALWEEINNSQKPEVLRIFEGKRNPKYRHDENVIAATPAAYRQIYVPKQEVCEYVTDDGLIIPSITRALRKKLWDAADKVGLTLERRVELMGRAASEISIQLLGGGHRLNPHNSHQFPTVVVLSGPHKQGAFGVSAARHLASHGVRTIVYTVSTEVAVLKKELALYALTKNPVTSAVASLPNFADLIILALCDDTDAPRSYPELCEWANRNRAPVLALDPPSVGTPGIAPKFSLVPVLPLPHSSLNGKLYLCNLGFPVDVFDQVGIQYKSPFGPKFVIPLHPRDE